MSLASKSLRLNRPLVFDVRYFSDACHFCCYLPFLFLPASLLRRPYLKLGCPQTALVAWCLFTRGQPRTPPTRITSYHKNCVWLSTLNPSTKNATTAGGSVEYVPYTVPRVFAHLHRCIATDPTVKGCTSVLKYLPRPNLRIMRDTSLTRVTFRL